MGCVTLILRGSPNFISPNLGKFSYALALTEVQRLYRYHVVLMCWRVACRSRMHWGIYYSEFREVKGSCWVTE